MNSHERTARRGKLESIGQANARQGLKMLAPGVGHRPHCGAHGGASRPQQQRRARRLSVICALAALTLAAALLLEQRPARLWAVEATAAESVAASNSSQTASSGRQQPSAGVKEQKTAPPKFEAKTTSGGAKSTGAANLESQSTDLSSMYVQIPIAEPTGSQAGDQMQQTQDGADSAGSADSNKATTWTGPWPKKFQIGYIKQSDLHQVLIESLKNDPFLGSTNPTGSSMATPATKSSVAASPATKTPSASSATPGTQAPAAATKSLQAPPSDAASLMAGGNAAAVAYPQLKAVQQAALATAGQQALGQPKRQQQSQWASNQSRLPKGQTVVPQSSLSKGNLYVPAANLLLQVQRNHNHINYLQAQHQQHHRNARHNANTNYFPHNTNAHHLGANLRQSQAHLDGRVQAPRQQFAQPQHNYMAQLQSPQQTIRFANFPSGSMKNQPIYTINNFPGRQQQQLDEQLQMIQMTSSGGGQQQLGYGPVAFHMSAARPPKSSDYFSSSWRPVASDESPQAPNGPQQANSNSLDGDQFDEGFGMPAVLGGGQGKDSHAMNQHPALNKHFGASNATSKVSPAKIVRELGGTKSPAGTKGAAGSTERPPAQAEEEQRQLSGGPESGVKGVAARRAPKPQANNATVAAAANSTEATTGTTTTTLDGPESTTAPSSTPTMASGDADASSTTTTAPISSNQTTTTQSSETTTEPDSEVIDSETTTESSGTDQEATTTQLSTTTTGSLESDGRSSTATPTSSTASSADGGDSEVVATQAPGSQASGAASFPAVQSEESAAGSSAGTESTTAAGQTAREETTPSSSAASSPSPAPAEQATTSDAAKGGEVEGSAAAVAANSTAQSLGLRGTDATLTDEALMAAAVRASNEVVKSRAASSGRQRAANATATSTSKRARSSNSATSERLVQESQARVKTAKTVGGRKEGGSSGNKLITRKPQSPSSSVRAGKQIGRTDVKGAGSKSAALSSTRASGDKKKTKSASSSTAAKPGNKKATSKITRMATASERLQAPAASQVVSMSAAQAQSTAQTLASLLLSRCLSSTNCAHLLDVCSTKQAAVPLNLPPASTSSAAASSSPAAANISAAWSVPVGLMSSNLMSLMQALQADRALLLFPAWRDAIENVVDQDSQTGYTLIVPSNDAIDRMAAAQVDALLANGDLMSQLIDNHILDAAETIELPTSTAASSAASAATVRSLAASSQSRYLKSKRIQVNQHRDRMATLNGKRVVYANQPGPGGGRIHVIDGVLDWPSLASSSSGVGALGGGGRLLDILDTLKQCDKFDGFVTLAEGTGLAQILRQDEPLTVFVPSNEALRKIPDEELEVIKNNSTALREFIMYHIVNGSYFSQDLRDGQQLASILDLRPIQVGVRVDGCSRRLVEANTSPMRRPDIVAKNGVIHILDWYLTTRDNEWCDPIGRSAPSSSQPTGGNQRESSERLQQLASEPAVIVTSSSSTSSTSTSSSSASSTSTSPGAVPTYATRMSLPANHKPATAAAGEDLQTQASAVKPTRLPLETAGQETNSVYVSSVPLSEVHMP